jgi:hypothetical protein
MKINVIFSAFAKSFICFVIGISIVLLNFHSLSVTLKIYDIIWIGLFYIFIGLLSYFFAIISGNASFLIFCADEICVPRFYDSYEQTVEQSEQFSLQGLITDFR